MINEAGQTGADSQGQLLPWLPVELESLSSRRKKKTREKGEKKGEIRWGRGEERSRRRVKGEEDNKWFSVYAECTDEVI